MNNKSVIGALLTGVLASSMSYAQSTSSNLTSLEKGDGAVAETYVLSLNAPKISNNTFPVPVLYFDGLLDPKTKLKATLNVPLKLVINNSRKRRLLTLITLDGDQAVPYGVNLNSVNQFKLSSYKDKTGAVAVTEFVGPNKNIFRTLDDNKRHEIDFILSINHKHFHNGFVKVALAASNGVELSQLCEVNQSDCTNTVVFRIVPRSVVSEWIVGSEDYFYRDQMPNESYQIQSTNVDLKVMINNDAKNAITIKREEVPVTKNIPFVIEKYNPNVYVQEKVAKDSYITNLDIDPIIYYMSSDAYVRGDRIINSVAARGPKLNVKNSAAARKVLPKLEQLSNQAPFNGQAGQPTTQANAEQPVAVEEEVVVVETTN